MRAALLRDDVADNVIEAQEGYEAPDGLTLRWLADDEYVSPGWRLVDSHWHSPEQPASTPFPAPVEYIPTTWADGVQAQLDAQRRIIDLLLLGSVPDDGDALDDVLLSELPDDGGSLDDLDSALDLPDSGETLESLGS